MFLHVLLYHTRMTISHIFQVDSLHSSKQDREDEMTALRQMCGDLVTSSGVSHAYTMQETMSEVEGRWNDLTELLVQQVSLEALSEIDGMLKYLDKAENEINTAEPISVDPETLGVQLRDHKVKSCRICGV